MVFASHSFLAFLLILLAVYWLAGRHHARWGKPILIVASFIFYGFWIPAYLILLVASILFNHAIARALMAGPAAQMRRMLTVLGIALNLALIGFYKYAAFVVESLNWTLHTGFDVPDIILPIGISFSPFNRSACWSMRTRAACSNCVSGTTCCSLPSFHSSSPAR